MLAKRIIPCLDIKDGHEYKVARQFQHSQARKAELNYTPDK